MKSLNSVSLKFAFLGLMLYTFVFTAVAQRLPNTQRESVLAPGNVKLDGKATEWLKFEAFNKSTLVYYTLANDQDKLYLVLKATDSAIVKKILNGGITFSIRASDKSVGAESITYPLLTTYGLAGVTAKMNNPEADMRSINQQLASSSKEMDVRGFKDIADTMISIYNEHGFRAKVTIDDKRSLTYELSVPLKYIQAFVDGTSSFRYKVKLNGVTSRSITLSNISKPNDDLTNRNKQVYVLTQTSTSVEGAGMVDLMSPTYFSAAYTLIKK